MSMMIRDVPKRKLFDSASNEYLMKLLGESESEYV